MYSTTKIRYYSPQVILYASYVSCDSFVDMFFNNKDKAPDFLAFRCVQCSIGLADVNVKKYRRKMKIDIEQPGSDTWFFLYPKAIFFVY